MPELVAPTPAVHASYLAAAAEFRAEGRLGYGDVTALAYEAAHVPGLDDPEGFAAYVAALRDDVPFAGAPPRVADWVPSTTLWYVDGATFFGRLSLRNRLNAFLRDVGGHIGYDVRPSARRRGHATAMLTAALPLAHALGIDPVLVTCDHDNVASRTVIERCGGIFEDRRGVKLRYWLPTGGAGLTPSPA